MTKIHRWSMMIYASFQAEFNETKHNGHFHRYGTPTFGNIVVYTCIYIYIYIYNLEAVKYSSIYDMRIYSVTGSPVVITEQHGKSRAGHLLLQQFQSCYSLYVKSCWLPSPYPIKRVWLTAITQGLQGCRNMRSII